ncbi:AAA family ATPase [Paenibacillus alginolyticus]|uniref:AAA family ATPase n=1 Tax=Paenibacillus alginolyticus TaxID=59839 RepID=UPI000415CE62|nr:AAA family ATPase [Paenibacillus alginolyticus]MCY9668728.1 AAA family ATPase [Paenibacillus alginolyticus]
MQVYFFRARKRDKLIEDIRQLGWSTRVIYDIHKVTKDIKWIILDASSGNWKTNAAIFTRKGLRMLLLIDEEISEDELREIGISGVLFPDEQFCARYLELTQIEEVLADEITATNEPNQSIPLSQRLNKTSSEEITNETKLPIQITVKKEIASVDIFNQQPETDTAESSFNEKMERSTLPSIVTVYGAKGGIGRTVFLLNLASVLAKFGLKACVLDLDLYHGTVAATLQVHPEWAITDLVRRIHEPKLRQTCLQQSEMGFSFVAAPTSYMDISGITIDALVEVIHFLKEEMDIVLIDIPTIFDSGLKGIMEHSDSILLMTSDESASVKNLRMMAGELQKLGKPQLFTIGNRVTGHGVSEAEFKEFLPWPLLLSFAEDATVGILAKRGKCIAIEQPTHAYSVQLERLVRRWVGQEAAANKSWLGSLQQRLIPKRKGGKQP